MYVVASAPVTWFPVEWSTLGEDGEKVTNSFRMKAELVDLPRFEGLLRGLGGAPAEGDLGPIDFIKDVARDWDEIVGPDRNPFPFTPENLLAVAYSPGFLLGWQLSYVRAWNGQTKEREKNSAGSPGDGRAAGENRKTRRAQRSSSRR